VCSDVFEDEDDDDYENEALTIDEPGTF